MKRTTSSLDAVWRAEISGEASPSTVRIDRRHRDVRSPRNVPRIVTIAKWFAPAISVALGRSASHWEGACQLATPSTLSRAR
jgi:hypothetical protein